MNDSAELPPDPFTDVVYSVRPGTPEPVLRKGATQIRRGITTARRASDLADEVFPGLAFDPKAKAARAELAELIVELEAQHTAVQLECLDRNIKLPAWRGDR